MTKGWSKPALGDIGFSIMVPEGWETETIGERSAQGGKPKDLSSALLGGWSDRRTGMMAVGAGDPSGKDALYMMFASREIKNPGTKVDQDIADFGNQLKMMGVTVTELKRTTVTLPVGKAEKIHYKSSSDLFKEVVETFFIVDGDAHYEVSFSTMGTEDVALPGDAVMTTFRPDF